jgi:hypothetical protein
LYASDICLNLAEIQILHNRKVLVHLGWPENWLDDLFGDRDSNLATWLRNWRAPKTFTSVWCSALRTILKPEEKSITSSPRKISERELEYMFSLRQILSNGGKDKRPEPESITSDHYAWGSLICFKQVIAIFKVTTRPKRHKQLFDLACRLLVRAVSHWQAEDARGPGAVFNEGLYGTVEGAKEELSFFAEVILREQPDSDKLEPLRNWKGCHVLIGACINRSLGQNVLSNNPRLPQDYLTFGP